MILAETTGMATWDVATWTLFFGAIATLLASLTASIIAIINAAKANKASDLNTQRISDVSQKVDRQPAETTDKIKLAMATPVVVVPTNGGQQTPPVPTPETLSTAFKENQP